MPSIECQKIFATNMTNKELISKLYEQLIKQNIKITQPYQKKGGRPKWTFFSQRRHTDGQQVHEKC